MAKTTMSSSDEKLPPDQIEDKSRGEEESAGMFSAKEAAAIRRRIDFRLIPALGLMYGISLMDRKNVSNAAIAGMRKDLDLLQGYRYSLITLTFFITYVIFQPPMTVLCRKIGPRLFLPGIFEVARRYSVFYLIGSFASALSGIVAYGLMQMEGVQGIRGWRWIFIMEGVITVAIALVGYLFIVRFPDAEQKKPSFRFLKPEECQFIVERLDRERGDVEPEKFNLVKFLKPAGDIEIWGFAFMFFCITTVTYSFSFFLPIILKDNLGFSMAASQCLIAPPYAFSAILMFTTAWFADRLRLRAPFIVFNSVLSLIGLPIMGFHYNPSVRYFGVFIGVAGANANVPLVMAYQANNIRGQWKRAFCSATLTGFGGIGGIAGSLVFRTQDKPSYTPGIIATMAACACVAITICLMTVYFKWQNAKADRGEKILVDDPDFRYTL
ncbi:phthalate transporter [Blastomyces gilchristii SLH14081]|uniref:Phthalate transporter n=1 Tax=Blastomyces gilchristii (strain SLH14081) TaxID=559298 RepID=A0A179UVD9_BLAGS|nr:phthalate transporter [Blastomyces gilchristii SLH14081]OAT12085.1 phthalate transporter [Blastomyces gilchristii SLH14081]